MALMQMCLGTTPGTRSTIPPFMVWSTVGDLPERRPSCGHSRPSSSTRTQWSQAGDIAPDHTRFIETDAPIAQRFVSGAVGLGNIEDNIWHAVQVSWDAETLRRKC